MSAPPIALLLSLCAALLGSSCSCGSQEPKSQPNILLILTDDQRYDTLSCTGNSFLVTPHIDRLAKEGVLFTRAYVTTSLCCPARASLLTGRYAHRTGIRNNEDSAAFLADAAGFPERLQDAGYETAFIGKWHIANPGAARQPGFDYWVSFEGQGQYDDETYNVDGETRVIPGFSTDVLTDLARQWIERPRAGPFCLILSVKNLHGPYFPPPRHRRELLDVPFPLPASYYDPEENLSAYTRRAKTTQRNRPFDHDGTHEGFVRGYHQLVLSIDDNLGRLYGTLESVGAMDSTAIAFTSDGGFMWGEHGLYRKRTAYEPSIHVPLLLRLPGVVPEGLEVDRLALSVDLAPTFLALAGVEAAGGMQGKNLAPLWNDEDGEDARWREDFLYFDSWGKFVSGPQELAVVGTRYKYVRYRRDLIEEALFDLQNDPDERRNLASQPEQADRLSGLRDRMVSLLAELEAPAGWMDVIPVGEDD